MNEKPKIGIVGRVGDAIKELIGAIDPYKYTLMNSFDYDDTGNRRMLVRHNELAGIDIRKEAALIAQKKSKLSASKRRLVMQTFSSPSRMREIDDRSI